MIYADTSLILSLYVADAGSADAGRMLAGQKEPLAWTAWHELEFTAALEARVGRGQNTRQEADAVFEELAAHRERDGLYSRRKADWDRVLERATKLAAQCGADYLCRSLDVLHVAVCLELGVSKFRTLDDRQRKLAERQGLELNRNRIAGVAAWKDIESVEQHLGNFCVSFGELDSVWKCQID